MSCDEATARLGRDDDRLIRAATGFAVATAEGVARILAG